MKNEKIKESTSKATKQLIAGLNEGRSETLMRYLAAIGRFHRWTLPDRHDYATSAAGLSNAC